MEHPDYYNDRKWCHCCSQYVTYLMSLEHSYCAVCGNRVKLFSDEDWATFHKELKERRPKGGRPRKKKADDRETA